MNTNSKAKIVLTAGGTGGHVFPAQALAAELTLRGYEVVFITDRRGDAFSKKFPNADIRRVFAGAYAGKPLLKKMWALFFMGLGVLQSVLILRRIKPAAVVGFGGYAAFPASFAAGLLKLPLIIHEQNTVLGGANRVLAKRAALIATTFPNVSKIPARIKTAYTGVPVRPDILSVRDRPYPDFDNGFDLLIFGGSQGAKILSTVVPEALKLLPDDIKSKLKIAQQCRTDDLDGVHQAYENSGLTPELAPFFSDMPQRLEKTHLVICRAGASTIAELAVAGRPAIIVPILRSPDAHQLTNARFIADNGGAFLMEEPDFTPQNLANKIKELFNSQKMLITSAAQAKSLGRPQAVVSFADAVLTCTKV